MERLVSSQLPDAARVPALYAYLVNDVSAVDVSVSWDAPAYAKRHPDACDDPGRILGHAWRRARERNTVELYGESRVPWHDALSAVRVAVSGKTAPLPVALPGSAVVIARLAQDEGLPSTPLGQACAAADRLGATLVLSVAAQAVEARTAAALLACGRDATIVVDDGDDVVARIEKRVRRASRIVVRGPHSEISADHLVTLADAAAQGPVAPLWLGWDGAVASAGIGLRLNRPFPLLAALPPEDARAMGPVIYPYEIDGTTFAVPVPRGEFPPRVLTGLTVRAPVPEEGYPTDLRGDDTDLDALVSHRGWSVASWSEGAPVFRRAVRTVALDDGTRVPSLRWALKVASPPGPPGEAWGDTHFARGLADALRRLGQDVVIDAYAARKRSTRTMDDVVLALRGPEPIDAQSDAVSILWVISHPDEIVEEAARGFDAVFAASTRWARERTRQWGRPVHPLLQCTDARRFRPQHVPRNDRYVFVGTARGIARPSVVEPVRAGFPVDVYGPDWRGYVPASSIVATHVPNAALPMLYEGARAVLNDHWPAMRREGFVSNRLFDVVGAGGRAISDDVEGIGTLFSGAVATYDTVPHLLQLLDERDEVVFAPAEELTAISERIRREHSFDARARTLLEAAIEQRQ
ncbi:glycosyltransferase family protein [Microbacterium proteolyticum]|uniref:glycosyltransferase family protein n=1 Tax=Microbacterium proteolyticum TaxID=1572644 RepID=UPI001FACEFA2|nr:glycosyltransferase [Microbacterium proteolyticum]MCI9857701.1 hypothetical protein [Microbacterium proteolyticum]